MGISELEVRARSVSIPSRCGRCHSLGRWWNPRECGLGMGVRMGRRRRFFIVQCRFGVQVEVTLSHTPRCQAKTHAPVVAVVELDDIKANGNDHLLAAPSPRTMITWIQVKRLAAGERMWHTQHGFLVWAFDGVRQCAMCRCSIRTGQSMIQ